MIWQMTYIHKLLKLCSATLMAHSFSQSGPYRPICLFLTQVDEDAASKTLQDLYSSKTKVKYLVKMFVIIIGLRVLPHFPSGIVERAKYVHA